MKRFIPFSGRKLCVLLAALIALSGQGLRAAEGPVVAVQAALQKQQLYFGELTGTMDEPTKQALRNFQARNRLPATGEIDSATLDMLQSPAAARGPAVEGQVRPIAEPQAQPEPAREPQGQARPMIESVPTPATVAKDRALLGKVESKREPLPPPSVPSVRPARVAAESARPEPPVETPAVPPTRQPALAPVAQREDAPPPAGGFRPSPPAVRLEVEESDPGPGPFEPNGVRIIRIPGTAADGRIYVTEEETETDSAPPPPRVREAEHRVIIRLPRLPLNLFHRIFRGD
jgi:peptidoglycan hydrolase-like protein with peptidoglycan-binding domain